MEERGKLQERLAEEEKGAAAGGGEGEGDGTPQLDPLDAFMSDVTVQLEQSKVS